MRRTLPVLLTMSLAAVLLALATLWLATEAESRVGAPAAPAPAALAEVRRLLVQHDPRHRQLGGLHVLTVTPTELQLLADQAAHLLRGAARVGLGSGRLDLAFSLPLAMAPGQRWLNVQARLGNGSTLPLVESLRIGHLWLPGPLARPAIDLALRFWDPDSDTAAPLRSLLRGVTWQPQQARVDVDWRADTPQRLFAWLLSAAQQRRLHVYHEQLAALAGRAAAAGGETGAIGLPALMAPLFALAQQRSRDGGDAAAENRAVLLTLALYANGRPIATLLPAARHWSPLPMRPVLFNDRDDFPQHFLVSAALAAEAGGPLADAIGLLKEVGDSRFGSGFSFNDLAANHAGRRFGRWAVNSPARLQAQLAGGFAASALMPDLSDLPEFLAEKDFVARFGGVGAPAYERLLAQIDARVAALPLYR